MEGESHPPLRLSAQVWSSQACREQLWALQVPQCIIATCGVLALTVFDRATVSLITLPSLGIERCIHEPFTITALRRSREAATMLGHLGDEAKLLAGGQSLIPLMKLRFANPLHLVDLNFIGGTSYAREEAGTLRFRSMLTRHAEIEKFLSCC